MPSLTGTHEPEAERARLWRIVDESLNEIYLFSTAELRFVYVNRGALNNLGYSLEEMRTMSPVDIKPAHTRESFLELVAPLVRGEKSKLVFQTDHRRANGSTYPAEVHLQSVPGDEPLFLAIINDVTDRLEAERALRANEARFGALIESSADLIMLVDVEGRLTFASPSVTALLGHTAEQLRGRELLSLVYADDRSSAVEAMARALTSAEATSAEFRLSREAGDFRTFAVSARNLLEHGDVRAIVLNARDITAERSLEEQLQQSRRLESVGRLAGGVAHDFNNILTTILAATEFLLEDPSLSGESARADVIEIQRAGRRASELTNQLLAFARRRVIRPQAVKLGTFLDSQQRFLQRTLGAQITLRTVVPDGTWSIFVDPAQLEQVIVNLAVNARDAMSRGGRLTFEVSNTVVDEDFAEVRPEVSPGAYVVVVVSDTGGGITAEALPHVFEPFFTTKGVGDGSGLGLATVYGIVRQANGHIWVYSEPGVGTTFKMYFPRAAAGEAEVSVHAPLSATGGTERLLVVEDDAMVRQMVVRALASAGYDVHSEPLPHAGLAWAHAQGGRFDLVVTDVVMPGMSGNEFAAQLTAAFPHVRVLYVSGYTENTIVHQGVLEQGIDFLGKPFSASQIRTRVRAILDRGAR